MKHQFTIVAAVASISFLFSQPGVKPGRPDGYKTVAPYQNRNFKAS
jgi:hypothetical protein